MSRDQRIDAVKNFIAANPTAKEVEIVAALAATRESVRSVMRYNNIARQRRFKGDDKPTLQPHPSGNQKLRAFKPVRRHAGLVFGTPISNVPTLPRDVNAKAFQPLPGATPPKALHLLERQECHWPVGEGFCGCYAETGRYCATHTKMSGKMVPRLVLA